MLSNLHVKNLALIEEENIDLKRGLIFCQERQVQVSLLYWVLLMRH